MVETKKIEVIQRRSFVQIVAEWFLRTKQLKSLPLEISLMGLPKMILKMCNITQISFTLKSLINYYTVFHVLVMPEL